MAFFSPRPQINLTIANPLQRLSLKEKRKKDNELEQARLGESLFVSHPKGFVQLLLILFFLGGGQ